MIVEIFSVHFYNYFAICNAAVIRYNNNTPSIFHQLCSSKGLWYYFYRLCDFCLDLLAHRATKIDPGLPYITRQTLNLQNEYALNFKQMFVTALSICLEYSKCSPEHAIILNIFLVINDIQL